MKKLILSTIFLLLMLFPTSVFAQDYKGCMDKSWSARSVCLKTRNDCVNVCLAPEGPADESCVRKCNRDQDACDKQASVDYDACIKVGKQVPTKSEVKEVQPKENDQQPQLDQAESNTDEAKSQKEEQKSQSPASAANPAQAINDWIMDNLGNYEPTVVNETQLQNRRQQINKEQSQTDSVLHKIVEDQLTAGATINNYSDGVMVENPREGSWIYISPAGVVLYSPQQGRRVYTVQTGEIEVDTKESTIDVETPSANIKSKGTHYWVFYDSDKRETVIGVYEGEVEVKTKDGKTTTISPSGGKPGVTVVSQKLSPVKLTLVGLVLAVVVGGAILIVRRKFSSKGFAKKKR